METKFILLLHPYSHHFYIFKIKRASEGPHWGSPLKGLTIMEYTIHYDDSSFYIISFLDLVLGLDLDFKLDLKIYWYMWISDKLLLLNSYNQTCNGYNSKILIFETLYYTRGEHILQKKFIAFSSFHFVNGEDLVIFWRF